MRLPAEVADKLAAAAEAAGLARGALFAAAAVEPGADLAYRDLCRLYESAAAASGDDAFGLHVGERTDPSMYGLLGYAAANSATLGESLEHLVAFQHVWSDAVALAWTAERDSVRLAYCAREWIEPEGRRHESEQMMSAILAFARKATGAEIRPRELRLEHRTPSDIREHRRIFRCKLVFAAPATELVLRRAGLARPLVAADLTLGALIRARAQSELVKRPCRESLVDEVLGAAERMLAIGRSPRLPDAARSIGLTPRTLQRRLAGSGRSWRGIVEEARIGRAATLLGDARHSLAEVAFRAGFSDTSAFHRAFRRKLGKTPTEHRLALLGTRQSDGRG